MPIKIRRAITAGRANRLRIHPGSKNAVWGYCTLAIILTGVLCKRASGPHTYLAYWKIWLRRAASAQGQHWLDKYITKQRQHSYKMSMRCHMGGFYDRDDTHCTGENIPSTGAGVHRLGTDASASRSPARKGREPSRLAVQKTAAFLHIGELGHPLELVELATLF